MSPAKKAEKFIEPTPVRMQRSMGTQVPFPDGHCPVTCWFQQVCQGPFRQRKPHFGVVRSQQRIPPETKTVLVPAGKQSRAARTAYSIRDISIRKLNPIPRDTVNMGCGNITAAIKPNISVTQVVGENDHYVWPFRPGFLCLTGKRRQTSHAKQAKFQYEFIQFHFSLFSGFLFFDINDDRKSTRLNSSH